MLFADLFFLYIFLPLFGVLYFFAWNRDQGIGRPKYENAVLILFSLLFYSWGEPVYVLLLLFCVGIIYVCGIRHCEILGIVLLVLLLVFFKYGNLIRETFLGWKMLEHTRTIHLPIGISFYIFQSISYLADVKCGRVRAQKHLSHLLLYISMFPQLIAGPIVRYTDVERQIMDRSPGEDDVAEGIRRFIVGLAKKVILADQLAGIVDVTMGGDPGSLSTGRAWLGLIAFSMQIYFDFSGYSDMAIGIGRLMGFRFPENFIKPYLCTSVTDFWRRWHITLGKFFRDYVYIPLGGNRVSWGRQILNILIVWMLTGIWHGAYWNYLIWGLYFGLWLLLEKGFLFRKDKSEKTGALGLFWRCVSVFAVVLGWGIFYYEDFSRMRQFFQILFGQGAPEQGMLLRSLLSQNVILLALSVFCCFVLRKNIFFRIPAAGRIVISAALLILSTLLLVGATNHPFLYTRF